MLAITFMHCFVLLQSDGTPEHQYSLLDHGMYVPSEVGTPRIDFFRAMTSACVLVQHAKQLIANSTST